MCILYVNESEVRFLGVGDGIDLMKIVVARGSVRWLSPWFAYRCIAQIM